MRRTSGHGGLGNFNTGKYEEHIKFINGTGQVMSFPQGLIMPFLGTDILPAINAIIPSDLQNYYFIIHTADGLFMLN